MKAMIFAAGLGTRLKPFTEARPKALAEVNGRSLLEMNIRYLQGFGIAEVIVNVHHFAEQIVDIVAENSGWGSKITISDEQEQVLETGGGLLKAMPFFDGEEAFVVMNVDVLTTLDLSKIIDSHKNNARAVATLAVMGRTSSRQLLFNEKMMLCGWQNNATGEQKMARPEAGLHPFAFSGIQVLSPEIWKNVPFTGKFSLIDLYLHAAKEQSVMGYDHSGDVFIDVGKPESLALAASMFS